MHVKFLSDGTEYRSFGGGNFARNKPGSGLFWWTILITLLMGLATFCWFFSIFVFSHPEKPFSYRLLGKLNKLEPIRKFSPLLVPQGKFMSARAMLGEYYSYESDQLAVANDVLKRAYIKNYKELAPKYLVGDFTVIASRPLAKSDVFAAGWIVRARSNEMEDVEIEYVFPGSSITRVPFTMGEKISLRERESKDGQKPTFASAINVQKLPEDRICVTVVPLTYEGATATGETLALEAPAMLNMDASWPVAVDLEGQEMIQPGEALPAPGQKVAAKTES